MKKPAPRRKKATGVAMTLVTFTLGVMAAVLLAASAAATSTTKKTTTKPKTTATPKTTTRSPSTRSTSTSTGTLPSTLGPDTNAPGAHYFVLNGTANAASDHEIAGTSAFPNFTTGAIDNYYSMAHTHVDNSPFAEGTASPADTGPIGQTAAAGNFQQPQYADARWPGDSGKATYGTQGQPYADASAGEFKARADASEASNSFSGPSAPTKLAAPKGFDLKLRQMLAGWKAKWGGRLGLRRSVPTLTAPATKPPIPIPTPIPVPAPSVSTPTATVGGVPIAPPVTVPSAAVPSSPSPSSPLPPPPTTLPRRSLASASTPSAAPPDGESLLESTSVALLDPKTDTLVTAADSRLGRVVLGGGQIVIEGIYVSATITNDGKTPTDKVVVSVASASIGGVPVTIDQDGVHVAGQSQGVPYKQASDSLNAALKSAGIQLFLVSPEITNTSCGSGSSSDNGGGTTTTSSSNDQSTMTTTSACGGSSSSSSSCDQSGTGTNSGTTTSGSATPANPFSPSTTTTTSSCDQSGMSSCDQTGTNSGTTTGSTTTTSALTPPASRSSTTTTSRTRTGTTSTTSTTNTTSSCSGSGSYSSPGSCAQPGPTTGSTPTSSDQAATTDSANPGGDYFGLAGGGGSSSQSAETVTATGLHVIFTQPVSQSGVPDQSAEHILGEVFLDSLAVPATPPTGLGDLSSSNLNSSFSSSSSSSSSCLGGGHSGLTGGSNLSAGGSNSGGALSSSASGFGSGSGSQPATGSIGNSLPAAFARALRKPLWLLLGYLLWQALVIGTGASLWNWRRDGAS